MNCRGFVLGFVFLWGTSSYSAEKCVAKFTYAPFPDNYEGCDVQYTRVHPNGKYFLFTSCGETHLGSIESGEVKINPTPLLGEAFPAPGSSWDLIASPRHESIYPGYSRNHDHGVLRVKLDKTGELIDPKTGHIVAPNGDILKRGSYKVINNILFDANGNRVYSMEMRYFRFSEILRDGINAQHYYSDSQVNNFYQSLSVEKSSGSSQTVGVLDQRANFRRTEFKFAADGSLVADQGPVQKICSGGTQGQHTYRNQSEKQRMELKRAQVIKKYRALNAKVTNMDEGLGCGFVSLAAIDPESILVIGLDHKIYYAPEGFDPERDLQRAIDAENVGDVSYSNMNGETPPEKVTSPYQLLYYSPGVDNIPSDYNCLNFSDSERKEFIAENFKLRQEGWDFASEYQKIQEDLGLASTRGMTLAQPMISPDGKEFALVQDTTRIYQLEIEGQCREIRNLEFPTSKVIFGPREKGQKGQIAYGDDDGKAWLLDRDKNRPVLLNAEGIDYDGMTSYPGFLTDGRILYIAKQNGKPVVVIADPNQIDPELGSCVLAAEEDEIYESEI